MQQLLHLFIMHKKQKQLQTIYIQRKELFYEKESSNNFYCAYAGFDSRADRLRTQ